MIFQLVTATVDHPDELIGSPASSRRGQNGVVRFRIFRTSFFVRVRRQLRNRERRQRGVGVNVVVGVGGRLCSNAKQVHQRVLPPVQSSPPTPPSGLPPAGLRAAGYRTHESPVTVGLPAPAAEDLSVRPRHLRAAAAAARPAAASSGLDRSAQHDFRRRPRFRRTFVVRRLLVESQLSA